MQHTSIYVAPLHKINNKNFKSFSSQSLEERTIHDLKPILYVSRLFGMAPYSMTNKKISLSNIGVIYSGVVIIFYVYVLFNRTKTYYNETMDMKLKVLSISRLMLLILTLCVDIILCIYWDRKMQNSLYNTWYYEKMIKFKRKKPFSFRKVTWILTIVNVIFFLLIALLSYKFDKAEGRSAIVYITLYLAMTFGVLKFLLIANIICRRFQDLNSHLTDELTVSKRLDVININEACNLLDLWSLHEQLSLAIKDLNSLYSLQLFLWISTIGFNIISRIYVFCTTILNKNFFWDLRETLLLIYFITLLAFLTITCHITAKQANKMSSIIFSPKYFQRSQQSSKVKLFMGHYLLKYCFNFTAAFGFFIVDIQLLLSIAGSITTYLVIIIGPNSL